MIQKVFNRVEKKYLLNKEQYEKLRCYGQPKEDSDIFLEIKKKYKGIVNKRRITLKPDEAVKYLYEDIKPEHGGQIMREIDFMKQRYGMKPVLYLAYDRLALYGKEDKEFRVTFDRNIRSRRENLTLFSDEENTYLLEKAPKILQGH